jgi:hypothetical protein
MIKEHILLLSLIIVTSPLVAQESATPQRPRTIFQNLSAEQLAIGGECTHSDYICLPDGKYQLSYFDPTGVCTWSFSVDWDDGSSPTTGILSAGGTIDPSHTYTEPGLYEVVIDFPPGVSSDPENMGCSPLRELFKVEVPSDDKDRDGWPDSDDNCPDVSNPDQKNSDKDQEGDACDTDDDNDGVRDTNDNCPDVWNESQSNADGDTKGDACDTTDDRKSRDTDKDGIVDSIDNCMTVSDPTNACSGETLTPPYPNPISFTGVLTRHLPTRPYVQYSVGQDSGNLDGTVGRWDFLVFEFSETMSETATETGTIFDVGDSDGTVYRFACGVNAVCDLNRGRAKGLSIGELKDRQGFTAILFNPLEISPGRVPGLPWPARLVYMDPRFQDQTGQIVDLLKSDRIIEQKKLF